MATNPVTQMSPRELRTLGATRKVVQTSISSITVTMPIYQSSQTMTGQQLGQTRWVWGTLPVTMEHQVACQVLTICCPLPHHTFNNHGKLFFLSQFLAPSNIQMEVQKTITRQIWWSQHRINHWCSLVGCGSRANHPKLVCFAQKKCSYGWWFQHLWTNSCQSTSHP